MVINWLPMWLVPITEQILHDFPTFTSLLSLPVVAISTASILAILLLIISGLSSVKLYEYKKI